MTTDRAPKEARDQKNRRQETQAPEEAFQIEAAAPHHPDQANILKLQRTIGNQAVQRLVAQGRLAWQSTHIQSKPVAAEPEEKAEQEFETAEKTVLRMADAAPPGEEAIQRDGETTSADAPAPDNNPSPEKARYLAYIIKVMHNVPKIRADDKMILENLKSNSSLIDKIHERDQLANEVFVKHFGTLPDPDDRKFAAEYTSFHKYLQTGNSSESDKPAPEVVAKVHKIEELNTHIQAELSAQGFDSEAQFMRLVRQFPEIWVRRAKDIAYTMLDQNAEKIQAEEERYHDLNKYGVMCSPDTDIDGLQAADQELAMLSKEVNQLNENVRMLTYRARGVREKVERRIQPYYVWNNVKANLIEQQQLLQEKSTLLKSQFQQYTNQFPIMSSPDYTLGSYYSLSYEQVEKVTGTAAQKILFNIRDTKENIADDTINVWDLRSIRELTFHELSVTEDSVLGQAVAQYIESELSDQRLFDIALGVIAFAAALISGPPGWVAGIAAAVDVGIGIYQVLKSADQMMAEAAAEYIALDNDEAIHDISLGEEEIIPLLMNVLGVKVDVAGVLSAKLVRAGLDIDDIHALLETGDRALDIQNITSALGEDIVPFLTPPSDVTTETEDSEFVSYPEDQAASEETSENMSRLTDDAQTEDSELPSYPEAARR